MPQLNVHIPGSSELLARIEAAAAHLGTTPSTLARTVLEVALDPYVQAQLELRLQERVHTAQVVTSLRTRFSGALPARPFVSTQTADTDEDTAHSGPATGPATSAITSEADETRDDRAAMPAGAVLDAGLDARPEADREASAPRPHVAATGQATRSSRR